MKAGKSNIVHNFIIGTFVGLYVLTSLISTIHVIDFFELSNPRWMAITLAVAFELGAAASLASIIVLDKMNKTLIWSLFISITLFQMQGNMYYAFKSIESFEIWAQLFDLVEMEPISQKRIMAGISGAILPLIALGFIKSLVDYIKPDVEEAANEHLSDADEIIVHETVNTEVESFSDLEGVRYYEDEELVKVEPIVEEPVKVEPIAEEPVRVEPIAEEPVRAEPIVEELVEKTITPQQSTRNQSPHDPKSYTTNDSLTKVGPDWIK